MELLIQTMLAFGLFMFGTYWALKAIELIDERFLRRKRRAGLTRSRRRYAGRETDERNARTGRK